MKTLFYLCVLGLVGLAMAATSPIGCAKGTHAYTSACGPVTPEPTCEEPNPKPGNVPICDYSACYCDAPTVRDTKTNKCVLRKQCTVK